jgi:predicted Na+-dependent transporter
MDVSFTADIKGALAGGIVSALMDTGDVWRGIRNGFAGTLISVVTAPAIVEALTKTGMVAASDNLLAATSAIMALVGVIVAEAIQRIARRLMARSETFADRVADKHLGKRDANDDPS